MPPITIENEFDVGVLRAEIERGRSHFNTYVCTAQTRIAELEAQIAALKAENEAMRELMRAGLDALNAAYAQVHAEHHGHDKTADKYDRVVMEWRRKARAALAQSSGGEVGDE